MNSASRYHALMAELAVIAVPDLMFQPRIEAAARALGFETEIANDAVSARNAIARRPAIVIVDLHASALNPDAVIRGAKAMGARVLAFGRHTEPGALRAARQAGADQAVARSQLVDELPQLIDKLRASAPRPRLDIRSTPYVCRPITPLLSCVRRAHTNAYDHHPRGPLRDGHRSRDARPAAHQAQDVLRLQRGLRRRAAEHPRLSRLHGASGRPARHQPQGRRVHDPDRPRAQLRDPGTSRSSTARTTPIRTC